MKGEGWSGGLPGGGRASGSECRAEGKPASAASQRPQHTPWRCEPPRARGRGDADRGSCRPQGRLAGPRPLGGQTSQWSHEQSCFWEGGWDPWLQQAKAPCTDAGRPVGLRVEGPRRGARWSRGLPSSPTPADPPRPEPPSHPGLATKSANNASPAAPFLVLCFLFNFPTNTLLSSKTVKVN